MLVVPLVKWRAKEAQERPNNYNDDGPNDVPIALLKKIAAVLIDPQTALLEAIAVLFLFGAGFWATVATTMSAVS